MMKFNKDMERALEEATMKLSEPEIHLRKLKSGRLGRLGNQVSV